MNVLILISSERKQSIRKWKLMLYNLMCTYFIWNIYIQMFNFAIVLGNDRKIFNVPYVYKYF